MARLPRYFVPGQPQHVIQRGNNRQVALGRPDSLLTEHPFYLALGRSPPARQAAYRALFRALIGENTLGMIRDATNKGWALGNDRFRAEIAECAQRRAGPSPRGRPKKGETAEKR